MSAKTRDDLYFAASGHAYVSGVEDFNSIMPQDRFRKLRRALVEVRGFAWCEKHFIPWITHTCLREQDKPACQDNCPYRMAYTQLQPQRNALRVEIFSPADRCGALLKYGRMGGRPDDYLPCTY